MDVRKSQTSTATPAKPGDFHCWFNHEEHEGHEERRKKTGEAWFLSPHPAVEVHRQGKVLFLFVIFVLFVVNWF
jgi:hypothetical protein